MSRLRSTESIPSRELLEKISQLERELSTVRTERDEAKKALVRLQTIIEESPFGVQIFAPDGSCLRANRAWEELWSASRDNLSAFNIRQDPQFMTQDLLPYIERAFSGEVTVCPASYYDPAQAGRPGRPRWISSVFFPGPSNEVVLVIQDVSGQKEAEAALRDAHQRAEKLVEERTEELKKQLQIRREVERAVQHEHAFLQAVVDNAHVGIIAADAEGRVTILNDAARTFYGIDKPGTLVEMLESADLSLPDESEPMPRHNRPLAQILRGESLDDVEYKAKPKRGRARYLVFSGKPLYSPEGQRLGSVVVMHDVTERKRAEWSNNQLAAERAARIEAEASERKIALILESISEAFIALDRDWRYTYVNRKAAELSGYPSEDLLGKVAWDFFPQAAGSRLFTELQRALDEQVPVQIEHYYSEKDVWLSADVYPSPEGVSVFIEDISHRKKFEQERARLTREAARYADNLRLLLQSTGEGIYGLDLDGNCTFVNASGAQMLGYEPEELTGRNLHHLIHHSRPDGTPYAEESCPIFLAMKDGDSCRVDDEVFFRADGRSFPVEYSSHPILQDSGISGVVVAFSDISERKRAETHLRMSEARKSAILETAIDCIITMDHTGRVVEFNPAAEKTFGYSHSEAVGKPLAGLIIPSGMREQHRKGLEHYLATGIGPVIGKRVEVLAERKDGTEFPVELSISVIPSADPPIFTGYLRDITERKRAEQEMLRQAAELARSNAELEQFAYLASHDLQEPLRTVASYTQLVAKRYRGKLDSDADEFIDYIVGGVNRMAALIQDLLDYSSLGKTEKLRLRPTSLEQVLQWALKDLQQAVSESGAVITHDPLPALPGDESRLIQLFQNLIGNAIKYRSSVPLQIHVSAARQDGHWLFGVSDNGMGIEPRFAEQIFGIFKRLHGKSYPGTGIGLAICKRIVEQHGGKIWVESELNAGATFYFTLVDGAAVRPSSQPG